MTAGGWEAVARTAVATAHASKTGVSSFGIPCNWTCNPLLILPSSSPTPAGLWQAQDTHRLALHVPAHDGLNTNSLLSSSHLLQAYGEPKAHMDSNDICLRMLACPSGDVMPLPVTTGAGGSWPARQLASQAVSQSGN